MPLPPFFSVDSYDLKSVSFKFGNDIFINFEMPRVAKDVDKIHITLQFRPSVIRGPWIRSPLALPRIKILTEALYYTRHFP